MRGSHFACSEEWVDDCRMTFYPGLSILTAGCSDATNDSKSRKRRSVSGSNNFILKRSAEVGSLRTSANEEKIGLGRRLSELHFSVSSTRRCRRRIDSSFPALASSLVCIFWF
jgi:hypothetical protein